MDKSLYIDEILIDIPENADIIAICKLNEHRYKLHVVVLDLLNTFNKNDHKLCHLLKNSVSNIKIGKEFGITEGAVRKRIIKLRSAFERVGLKNFL